MLLPYFHLLFLCLLYLLLFLHLIEVLSADIRILGALVVCGEPDLLSFGFFFLLEINDFFIGRVNYLCCLIKGRLHVKTLILLRVLRTLIRHVFDRGRQKLAHMARL